MLGATMSAFIFLCEISGVKPPKAVSIAFLWAGALRPRWVRSSPWRIPATGRDGGGKPSPGHQVNVLLVYTKARAITFGWRS
uniref:Uncharacterized protein n=1 Tax=mine drainage metagenome TaxID=410659 RepID=E6QBR2_9ZZZZ